MGQLAFFRFLKVKSRLIPFRGIYKILKSVIIEAYRHCEDGNRPRVQGAKRAGVWCKSGGCGRGASSRSTGV